MTDVVDSKNTQKQISQSFGLAAVAVAALAAFYLARVTVVPGPPENLIMVHLSALGFAALCLGVLVRLGSSAIAWGLIFVCLIWVEVSKSGFYTADVTFAAVSLKKAALAGGPFLMLVGIILLMLSISLERLAPRLAAFLLVPVVPLALNDMVRFTVLTYYDGPDFPLLPASALLITTLVQVVRMQDQDLFAPIFSSSIRGGMVRVLVLGVVFLPWVVHLVWLVAIGRHMTPPGPVLGPMSGGMWPMGLSPLPGVADPLGLSNSPLSPMMHPQLELVVLGSLLIFPVLRLAGRMDQTVRGLSEEAQRDPLTGAMNRRGLDAYVQDLRCATAVVLLDLDDFKRLNDRYGHHAGDRVLCRVAALLEDALRGRGRVVRWGGEEFLVVVPLMPGEEAETIGTALQTAMHNEGPMDLGDALRLRVTASLGVALSRDGHASLSAAIRTADAALYRAKRAGKNRVVCDTVFPHALSVEPERLVSA